jgi:hypothetical protein
MAFECDVPSYLNSLALRALQKSSRVSDLRYVVDAFEAFFNLDLQSPEFDVKFKRAFSRFKEFFSEHMLEAAACILPGNVDNVGHDFSASRDDDSVELALITRARKIKNSCQAMLRIQAYIRLSQQGRYRKHFLLGGIAFLLLTIFVDALVVESYMPTSPNFAWPSFSTQLCISFASVSIGVSLGQMNNLWMVYQRLKYPEKAPCTSPIRCVSPFKTWSVLAALIFGFNIARNITIVAEKLYAPFDLDVFTGLFFDLPVILLGLACMMLGFSSVLKKQDDKVKSAEIELVGVGLRIDNEVSRSHRHLQASSGNVSGSRAPAGAGLDASGVSEVSIDRQYVDDPDAPSHSTVASTPIKFIKPIKPGVVASSPASPQSFSRIFSVGLNGSLVLPDEDSGSELGYK